MTIPRSLPVGYDTPATPNRSDALEPARCC